MNMAWFRRMLGIYGSVGDGVVDTAQLADGAVTGDKIAEGTVIVGDIGDLAVTAAKLAANAVETDKILDGAVVEAKLGAGAVTATKIGAAAVETAKIKDGAVTADKLAAPFTPGAGVIANAHIAAEADIAQSKLALANGQIPIGQAGDVAEGKTVGGDLTIASSGVAAIATGVIVNADVADAAAIAASKLEAIGDGKILVGADSTGVPTARTPAGDVTMDNVGATLLNAALKEQLVIVPVEDLAADADIADLPVFVHPLANTLQKIGILTKGAPAGVDDANTVVVTLKDSAGNTIVTKTYDTGTQPPNAAYEDLGALDVTHKVLTAGEHVELFVTQGATGDMPAFDLVFTTVPTNA